MPSQPPQLEKSLTPYAVVKRGLRVTFGIQCCAYQIVLVDRANSEIIKNSRHPKLNCNSQDPVL